ncbi:TonB-dependent receptor, partial [Klebsiella pneumoniae]|nr:TonB-dependent receptor [Klebsiella pneumoniae]
MTLPEMIKMTIKPSPFSIRAVSSAIVLALGLTAAPALHGSYSAQTAIRTLLAGSGLTLVQQGSSYVIRPLTTEAETILIPETRVQGELAYHPATDVMSAPQYITAEEIRQRNTGDGNVT